MLIRNFLKYQMDFHYFLYFQFTWTFVNFLLFQFWTCKTNTVTEHWTCHFCVCTRHSKQVGKISAIAPGYHSKQISTIPGRHSKQIAIAPGHHSKLVSLIILNWWPRTTRYQKLILWLVANTNSSYPWIDSSYPWIDSSYPWIDSSYPWIDS